MKRLFLIIAILLYAAPAFPDPSCLQLPIDGNGIDVKGSPDEFKLDDKHGAFRPSIPKQLTDLNSKLAYTFTTIGFPKIIGGKPAFSTVFACFPDALIIPAGLGPMTRDYAAMLAHNRDPKVMFNPDALKVKEPKTTAELFLERLWRAAARYIGPAIAWATTSTDDFNRADSGDLGAAWDPYDNPSGSACRIVSNQVANSTDGVDCVEGYSTLIPGANQYSQISLVAGLPVTGLFASAIVRLQAPPTYSGYYCRAHDDANGNTSRIRRVDASSNSTLANDTTTPQWAAGDVLRCEITANIITLKKNGATIMNAVTAGEYTTGRGGINVIDSTADIFNPIDNFEVGDLGATAGVVRHRPLIIQ